MKVQATYELPEDLIKRIENATKGSEPSDLVNTALHNFFLETRVKSAEVAEFAYPKSVSYEVDSVLVDETKQYAVDQKLSENQVVYQAVIEYFGRTTEVFRQKID